ncbi:MAG: hypothetical protein HEP71_34855 [Roseivirga sp.]|nr:hypothetical protein [Roseivirga sp.]
MKKTFLSITLLVLGAVSTLAQTKINQTFDVKSFDELNLIFEYPELVQVKVWDGNDVKIEGTVNIQNGEFDEDFQIKSSSRNGEFTIESSIKDLKKKRGNYSVYTHSDDDDDDDTSVTVSSKGTTINVGSRKNGTYRNGINISIELVVTIPRNMKVMLDARYGLVEVHESPKALEVDARYGGVDVTINESQSIAFDASTQWGQIFTNLDVPIKMGGDDGMGKWMRAKASLKKGDNQLSVESQYGNVYLRKN